MEGDRFKTSRTICLNYICCLWRQGDGRQGVELERESGLGNDEIVVTQTK